MKKTRFAAVIAFGLKVLGLDALPKGEEISLILIFNQTTTINTKVLDFAKISLILIFNQTTTISTNLCLGK